MATERLANAERLAEAGCLFAGFGQGAPKCDTSDSSNYRTEHHPSPDKSAVPFPIPELSAAHSQTIRFRIALSPPATCRLSFAMIAAASGEG